MVHTLFDRCLLCIWCGRPCSRGRGLSDFPVTKLESGRKNLAHRASRPKLLTANHPTPELGLVISIKSAKASVYWINSSFSPWSSAHSAAPTWELTFPTAILHLWNTHFVFSPCFTASHFQLPPAHCYFLLVFHSFALLHLSSNSVK